MPAIPAVFPQPKVLEQATGVLWPGTMGHISGNRVSRLVYAGEAFRIGAHECANALCALTLDPRGDIHQYQSRNLSTAFPGCETRRQSAQRRAPQKCRSRHIVIGTATFLERVCQYV